MKLLLDTDIGNDIDDALALAYLLREPECELLGITTVCGEPEKRCEMASAICRHLGPADNSAVDFLRRTIRANPGEVTLLAIGPLTNVATLFTLDPEIPSLLKGLTLMCGRFFDKLGGEWNAFLDPWATGIVYGNTAHPRPAAHVSYGLDVTEKVQLPRDEARRRFAALDALGPVRDFAEVWFARSERVTFHDPLAAVGVFHPEVCTYRDAFVRVSQTEPTLGWTVPCDAPEGAPPPHRLAHSVDADAFFRIWFGALSA